MRSRARTAIAIRHVAFEDLGLLSGILGMAGWSVSYVEAPTADLNDPVIGEADLLIVLGGPIGAYEIQDYPFLSKEIGLLEKRLGRNQATLGICLGCQLMAKALGSSVYKGSGKEIGWGNVQLTAEGRASSLKPLDEEGAAVLHWHGDTFDLPVGAVRLASSTLYENQAFAYGQRSLALQFHIEADPSQLEAWYVGHSAELFAAGVTIPRLRAAATSFSGRAREQAKRVFNDWLNDLGRRLIMA